VSLPSIDAGPPYDRLLTLLEIERREEVARHAASSTGLTDAEREARGSSVTRLEALEEEAGLSGRNLVTFAKATRLPLPPGALDTGDPVALGAADMPPGSRPPHGVVVRREEARVVVAFEDDLPEWAEGTRLRLDALADDATHRKLRGALERVRGAKKGERLFELREAADGARPLAEAKPRKDAPAPELPGLNETQRAAVLFALDAPDWALIHGPPGTGKTTAVVALIAAAIARGEKVLAAAASNAAVDLLAERLSERGLEPVRTGHPARIAPAVLASSLDERVRLHEDAKLARELLRRSGELRRKAGKWTRAAPDREERRAQREEAKALRDDARRIARTAVEKVLDAANVVCATLSGCESEHMGARRFDLVVVDEAAQALEPATWLAIGRARERTGRIVLAGDHRQLPPTVLSQEAERKGLGRTLFARLHERFGERAARMLAVQYRMHEAIAAFSSERFYEGRLVAAEANRAHLLGDLEGASLEEPWTTEPLLLYDTAGAGFDEERPAEGGRGSLANPREADIVAVVVRAWLAAGIDPRAVGVISPYAAQVAALRERLQDECALGLEVGTADGFQGREREAIALSLVRSNDRGEIGFLSDHRRANVALTRARRAMAIVGDGATLGGDPFYAALWERCERAGALRSAYELM